MFPLYSICSFLVLLGNVSTGREIWFLPFERTTTVEGDWMILVDLSEMLFRLGKRGDLSVL